MLKKTIVPLLAFALVLAPAVAAAPQGIPSATWLERIITGVFEAVEKTLLSATSDPASPDGVQAIPQHAEENPAGVQHDPEEAPAPDYWPGYDPIG